MDRLCDQRFSDTASEYRRVADTVRGNRSKDLDHTDDSAKQAQQRRYRCNRAERIEVALEFMHDVPAGVLNTVLHDLTFAVTINEAGRENLAQRGSLVECLYLLLVEGVAAESYWDQGDRDHFENGAAQDGGVAHMDLPRVSSPRLVLSAVKARLAGPRAA